MNMKLTDNDGWTYEFINAAPYDKMFITSPYSGKTYAVDQIALSEDGDGVFEFTLSCLFRRRPRTENRRRS